MILTDCYVLCASTILKTFKIHPVRAAFSCFRDKKSCFFMQHEIYDLLSLVSCNKIIEEKSPVVSLYINE